MDSPTAPVPAVSDRPRTSTRDREAIGQRFAAWLAERVRADDIPSVRDITVPGSAGFSSETLLIDVAWTAAGRSSSGGYVVRLPPAPDAFPLFPRYDLQRQVSAMRFVRERTSVPIPRILWFEESPGVLGAPFFVMERIAARGVPDMPPYVFGGWVVDADEQQQGSIRSGLVDILVGIHELDRELSRWELDVPGDTALRRHVENQRRYYDWIRGDIRLPVVDAAFRWLDDHWPRDEGEAVLSWGDARLANVLWHDFTPAAVLDWEAVAVGPPELDLGWMIFFHEYFQRIAETHGYVGAPTLLPRDLVVDLYAERSGHAPRAMEWYLLYAELRQALTSIRVSSRAVHFGEQPRPDDPQDLIMDRAHLEELVSR